MEHHPPTTVYDANATKSNLNNAVDPSISKGNPLVSSWLPLIYNSLSSLLHWTGSYSAEMIEYHLAFVAEAVVPRLKPPAAADEPRYLATHSHGIYEASIAFASHTPAKVRFSVQPLVSPACDDLLGQKGTREKIEGIASVCSADRTWLDDFVDSVFLTAEEEAELVDKKANGDAATSTPLQQNCFVAFDLETNMDKNGNAAIIMKTYLFPQLKALATGQKLVDITESVMIRLAGGNKDMLAAWNLLKTFLVSNHEVNIDFLAIDCLAPHKKPRAKVYVHTRLSSLSLARTVFTLGGLLPNSSADFLSQVWPLLMDMEDVSQATMDGVEKPLNKPDKDNMQSRGLCFTLSLVPGKVIPQIKMYVPMWQYARNEADVLKRYQRILQTEGTMGDYDIGAAVQGAL
ncbi:Putative aromatic prenyltransferase [Colletotrichum destructivum]|uniref:Aromatic prenyltransferase n=1 Tax=Colletotrichum destructivum TaxID=34406 RepID=A0AAX4J1C3_9PEZI|nr:Putative aromatic prenyltransferase [Colletotrichum destructivum]